MNKCNNFPSHIVDCGYPCTIKPLVHFNGWILLDMCSVIFHNIQIQCLSYHKTVEKWLWLNKYEYLIQYFAPILSFMYIIVPNSLLYLYGWILAQLHQCSFLIIQINFLVDHKIVEKWRYLKKYEELPHYFSPILWSMYIHFKYSLWYFYRLILVYTW